ncbi:MAG: ribonuclease HI [Gammaproteobacteria bacterium]
MSSVDQKLLAVKERLDQADYIVIYTDGACSGNPGPGGWGVFIRYGKNAEQLTEIELCGGQPSTTNNRMEMLAVLQALLVIPECDHVEIHTDSTYVYKGITEWLEGWKRKGWRKSSGKALLNADLWRELDALPIRRRVQWHWVRGHSGNPGNEKADELANKGMAAL